MALQEIGQDLTFVTVSKDNIEYFESLLDKGIKGRLLKPAGEYAIGVFYKNEAAGILAFQEEGIITNLEWLVVSDELRRKGIGTALISELCSRAFETDTAVIGDFFIKGAPEKDERYCFFRSLPFFSIEKTDEALIQISREDFEACILNGINIRTSYEMNSYADLSSVNRKRFLKRIGIEKEVLGPESKIIDSLSLYIEKRNQPVAAIFVSGKGKKTVSLNYLWSKRHAVKELLQLLVQTFNDVYNNMPEVTTIQMAAVTEPAVKLLNKIFPNRQILSYMYSVSYDMDMPPMQIKRES